MPPDVETMPSHEAEQKPPEASLEPKGATDWLGWLKEKANRWAKGSGIKTEINITDRDITSALGALDEEGKNTQQRFDAILQSIGEEIEKLDKEESVKKMAEINNIEKTNAVSKLQNFDLKNFSPNEIAALTKKLDSLNPNGSDENLTPYENALVAINLFLEMFTNNKSPAEIEKDFFSTSDEAKKEIQKRLNNIAPEQAIIRASQLKLKTEKIDAIRRVF